jgi:hypothetical protein
MQAVLSSETSVKFLRTTGRHIPVNSTFRVHVLSLVLLRSDESASEQTLKSFEDINFILKLLIKKLSRHSVRLLMATGIKVPCLLDRCDKVTQVVMNI